jgi:hypothetical protein
MPEVTMLIYTARTDYPYAGKAEGWHCFEPFLRTLRDQTFKDFELVLVDALWESRPEWFKDHPQPFPVKHVSSRPNYWQDRGRPGLSAQLNRGFVWADGKYVWMGAENNMFPPHHLELFVELSRAGKVPVGWYGIVDERTAAERGVVTRVDGTTSDGGSGLCPDVIFNLHGFVRDDVVTWDHRGGKFVTDPSLVIAPCHHQNYFGYSSVPLDAAIAINGFDELMDGTMSLLDCDFGSRLELHGCDLVMHRNLYVIEPPVATPDYGGGIRRRAPFQCNYALWWYNRLSGRKVNMRLPVSFVEDVRELSCRSNCLIKEGCSSGQYSESLVYPFCGGLQEPAALEWFAHASDLDLVAQRELRKLGGPPYDRAFIRA